jgi:hypothetical protein
MMEIALLETLVYVSATCLVVGIFALGMAFGLLVSIFIPREKEDSE